MCKKRKKSYKKGLSEGGILQRKKMPSAPAGAGRLATLRKPKQPKEPPQRKKLLPNSTQNRAHRNLILKKAGGVPVGESTPCKEILLPKGSGKRAAATRLGGERLQVRGREQNEKRRFFYEKGKICRSSDGMEKKSKRSSVAYIRRGGGYRQTRQRGKKRKKYHEKKI